MELFKLLWQLDRIVELFIVDADTSVLSLDLFFMIFPIEPLSLMELADERLKVVDNLLSICLIVYFSINFITGMLLSITFYKMYN